MGFHRIVGLDAFVRRARAQPGAVQRAADAVAAELDSHQGRKDPQGAHREDLEGLADALEKEGGPQNHHELSGTANVLS